MEIKHENNMFYIGDSPDKAIAEITYVPTGEKRIIIDHTFVSDELRGQGIAQKLLKEVTDWARAEEKKIIPLCPFAKREMESKEEYHDLLDR